MADAHIFAELSKALAQAAATDEGKRFLAGHDEDFQFDLDEGNVFYVSIENGGLKVVEGRMPKTGYYETTYVETDAGTLREMMKGKLRPIDAIEHNRFRMIIRMYEGCQITILLRIAGDLAREKVLAAG